MGLIMMSDKELARLKVIQDLVAKKITPGHAALVLKVTTRQIRTLRSRFLESGPAGVTSRHRGKPSNHITPASLKNLVMELIRTHYHDFGPTFASEKLREKHGLSFSPNTVRAWMKLEGLWLDRKKRRQTVHQPRYRRECYGELVQIDASQHHWYRISRAFQPRTYLRLTFCEYSSSDAFIDWRPRTSL